MHSETRLGGMEDAEAEEVKLSPSIHRSFQAFEPIDLTFDLPLAPRQGTGRVIAARTLLAKLLSSVT